MTQPATPSHEFARLKVRQKVTFMVNRYEVIRTDEAGNDLGLLCFAEQKRMAMKEQVTFFTDAAKTHPLFGFKARKVIDLGSGYDIVDGVGQPIGWFRKDFTASLGRSTWHLGTPEGFECVGQERNVKVAVLRRVWDFIPVAGDLPVPWLFHFDFTAGDGSVVMRLDQEGRHQGHVLHRPPRPAERVAARLAGRVGDGRRPGRSPVEVTVR